MPVKTVPGRWLKNIKDGSVYAYSDLLAGNPAVKEVPAEVAFPEKFTPSYVKDVKSKVNLDGPDDDEAPKQMNVDLGQEVAADIAKKSDRAHNADGTFKADDPSTPGVNEAFKAEEAPEKAAPKKRAPRRKKAAAK
jgi:hypothetical protein